jgi:sulfoxide reductase heme-binding subunit YedZ
MRANYRWVKAAVFLLCLGPLAALVVRGLRHELGANPIEFITHATGDWTLRFLVLTLAVTPLRRLLDLPQLVTFRRTLGLFAFFYGTLHLTTYVWLDQFFDVRSMVKDVAKRPFITAGLTAFLLLVPLAVTSTNGWMRRLGRRWQTLHRLVYASAVAAIVHYLWLVKSDRRLPLLYGAVVALLLGARIVFAVRKARARAFDASPSAL